MAPVVIPTNMVAMVRKGAVVHALPKSCVLAAPFQWKYAGLDHVLTAPDAASGRTGDLSTSTLSNDPKFSKIRLSIVVTA